MKLETTYENNNYPIIVEHDAIEYLILLPKIMTKYSSLLTLMYHQFSKKIDTLTKSIMRRKLSFLLANKLKHFAQYNQTMESLLSHQLTRQTCIIALGGGATGDFCRFHCCNSIKRCRIYPSSYYDSRT